MAYVPNTTWADGAGGGTPLSAARLNNAEAGIAQALARDLAYTQITAPASITATTEATANTVVTASAVTFDGATVVQIEFYAPYFQPDAAAGNRVIIAVLYDGAASIGLLANATFVPTGTQAVPVFASRRLTPSSAAHTYSIRAYVSAGTGAVGAGAGGSGAYMPAFIRITRV